MPLYAKWISEIAGEIYTEHTPDASWEPKIREELMRSAAEPTALLLVAECVDPDSPGGATAPTGYREGAVLLTIPSRDPLLGTEESSLRVLFTIPSMRNRGLASTILQKAESILKARGVKSLRVDAFYGDDAIVGLFERREYERGRMSLRQGLND